jgi:hypothetical protein
VATHEFSERTAVFRADPEALFCIFVAASACQSASLEVSQTAVDVGVDYRLTVGGPVSGGCDARLVATAFGPSTTRQLPTLINSKCTARIDGRTVLITCRGARYRLPSSIGASMASPLPERTFGPQPSEGPNGYPTGDGAQVVAVAADAAGHPLITLLIPNMNCPAMYFEISATPAPNGRPCVVTFDSGTGQVRPADATAKDPGASCPAWPTPHVTFVVDPLPSSGCTADPNPVAGLHPGAIGWLVEGGGVPYFALADGTEFHSPPRASGAPVTPSVAPTP